MPAPAFVLRIENDQGDGVYTATDPFDAPNSWAQGNARNPPPMHEGEFGRIPPGEFGFASLAQFRRWFHAHERKALHKKYDGEFRLVIYIPVSGSLKRTKRQCVFRKQTRVAEFPLDTPVKTLYKFSSEFKKAA